MGVRRLCWSLEQIAIPTNALVPFPTLTTGRVLGQQDWDTPTTRGRPAHTMFFVQAHPEYIWETQLHIPGWKL